VILWTFRDHDDQGERALCIAFPAHAFNFHIDVTVVLVPLADAVQILLQLRLVQPAGLINKRNDRFALRFHLLAQPPVAEMRVPLETDLAYRPFRALVDGENDACSSALLVDYIHPKLHANIGKAVSLVNFDDLLPRFLQLLFVYRLVESQLDFFSQLLRFDALSSLDYDLVHDRAGLHWNDHFYAVTFGLGEDANI